MEMGAVTTAERPTAPATPGGMEETSSATFATAVDTAADSAPCAHPADDPIDRLGVP